MEQNIRDGAVEPLEQQQVNVRVGVWLLTWGGVVGKSSCVYWDGRLEEGRQEEVRQRPARFCSTSEGSSVDEGAVICIVI